MTYPTYKFEKLSDEEFEKEMETLPTPDELGMMYRYQAIIWCIEVAKELPFWRRKSHQRLKRIERRAITGA